jgi:hypothetical protein
MDLEERMPAGGGTHACRPHLIHSGFTELINFDC